MEEILLDDLVPLCALDHHRLRHICWAAEGADKKSRSAGCLDKSG